MKYEGGGRSAVPANLPSSALGRSEGEGFPIIAPPVPYVPSQRTKERLLDRAQLLFPIRRLS